MHRQRHVAVNVNKQSSIVHLRYCRKIRVPSSQVGGIKWHSNKQYLRFDSDCWIASVGSVRRRGRPSAEGRGSGWVGCRSPAVGRRRRRGCLRGARLSGCSAGPSDRRAHFRRRPCRGQPA
eukprot:scaffold300056_cov49-Prasinocladus_malaysianus.AAC.3